MTANSLRRDTRGWWTRALSCFILLVFVLAGYLPAQAAPTLTLEIITWDVIGLDSNDVTTGPNLFPVAVRVCNTSATEDATNVAVEYFWDSTNPYINLSGTNLLTADVIPAGDCKDFYFNVEITRTSAAYLTSRDYHITVTADGVSAVSTPQRQLYVEKLVSQNRNAVDAINGPTEVYVGGTYQFTLDSHTATNGYEQLETFLTFPNAIFEIISVESTYSAPAGATNDSVYADACGWDPATRTCVGPGNFPGDKAGGTIFTTYTVRIIGTGTATLSDLIYDFSGSSYHYNSDYNVSPNLLTVTALSPLDAEKRDTLLIDADGSGSASPGDTIRYTITISNLGSAPLTGVIFRDTPDLNTTLIAGSVTTTRGTVTIGNTSGDTSVRVDIATLPATSTATIVFDVVINNPLPDGVTQIANQGRVASNEVPTVLTDDPDTGLVDDPTITPVSIPTSIVLVRFASSLENGGLLLEWATSAELDTWGFHLYRSSDRNRDNAVQITPNLIIAQGSPSSGGSYTWHDSTISPGTLVYYYWLQEVRTTGATGEYGPKAASAVLQPYKFYVPALER